MFCLQKIKKEKEQFKLSDPLSVQVQCDNDADDRDPGEMRDMVSRADPMLSSIGPDNTKMWRSLSTESIDDTDSLVYYKVRNNHVSRRSEFDDIFGLSRGNPSIRRRSLARLARSRVLRGRLFLKCISLRPRGYPWSPDRSPRGQCDVQKQFIIAMD